MRTTCINLFLQAKSAQEIKVAIFLKQNTYLWPSHNIPYHVVFKGEVWNA